MPANEFEKQVQQKMDEFRPEPSASVWQKVEEEIRKKKRRRIIFFLLLPAALLLLGYSVYYFTNTRSENEMVQQPATVANKKVENTGKKEIPVNEEEDKIQQPTTKETKSSAENKTDQTKVPVTSHKDEIDLSLNKPSAKNKQNEKPGKNIVKRKPEKVKQDDDLAITNNDPNKQRIVKPTTEEKDKAENKITPDITAQIANNDDSIAGKSIIVQSKPDSIVSNEAAKTDDQKEMILRKKITKSNIRWGIDLSLGISGSSSSLFSIGGQKSFSDAMYNIPGSATGGGTVQAPRIAPSTVQQGLSFKTGVTIEFPASKRNRFSTGLQYVYVSNSIKTGNRLDTFIRLNNNSYSAQANAFYRGTHRNNYTNRLHFIQLPLQYHLQLNKGNKLPLQWNIGMSFGYLVATNGLIYDTSYGGIYYKNKDLFNKFHFNVGTGFSIRLKGKNGMEWSLGPEFSFDTRRLSDNPFDKKQYLFYGGIGARLLFPQKKK